MAEKTSEINDILNKLIKALNENRIAISEAYLFGSYARSSNSEYSDIDVALVSNEFTGIRYLDIKKIKGSQCSWMKSSAPVFVWPKSFPMTSPKKHSLT